MLSIMEGCTLWCSRNHR